MHEEGAIDGQLLEGEACILLGKMLIHSSLPATGIFFFFFATGIFDCLLCSKDRCVTVLLPHTEI